MSTDLDTDDVAPQWLEARLRDTTAAHRTNVRVDDATWHDITARADAAVGAEPGPRRSFRVAAVAVLAAAAMIVVVLVVARGKGTPSGEGSTPEQSVAAGTSATPVDETIVAVTRTSAAAAHALEDEQWHTAQVLALNAAPETLVTPRATTDAAIAEWHDVADAAVLSPQYDDARRQAQTRLRTLDVIRSSVDERQTQPQVQLDQYDLAAHDLIAVGAAAPASATSVGLALGLRAGNEAATYSRATAHLVSYGLVALRSNSTPADSLKRVATDLDDAQHDLEADLVPASLDDLRQALTTTAAFDQQQRILLGATLAGSAPPAIDPTTWLATGSARLDAVRQFEGRVLEGLSAPQPVGADAEPALAVIAPAGSALAHAVENEEILSTARLVGAVDDGAVTAARAATDDALATWRATTAASGIATASPVGQAVQQATQRSNALATLRQAVDTAQATPAMVVQQYGELATAILAAGRWWAWSAPTVAASRDRITGSNAAMVTLHTANMSSLAIAVSVQHSPGADPVSGQLVAEADALTRAEVRFDATASAAQKQSWRDAIAGSYWDEMMRHVLEGDDPGPAADVVRASSARVTALQAVETAAYGDAGPDASVPPPTPATSTTRSSAVGTTRPG